MRKRRFLGLDVHADTIAVAEPNQEVRSVGIIIKGPESIRSLVKKLGPPEQLRVCCEAEPKGYVVYWRRVALSVRCGVVARTLASVKLEGPAKTDPREARRRGFTRAWPG